MNSALMFSKASDEWSTPQDFFDALHLEFVFEWDAAAMRENAKLGAHCYFGPDHTHPGYQDALAVTPWATFQRRRFWLNPPYSQCRAFIAKAAAERWRGATTVCLVPARTDTRWWHESVWDQVRHAPRPGVEVRFVKGRLTFGGAPTGAPFPSVVIVFRCTEVKP
jgi:phage N-6-adenine-methyltransferase